MRIATARKELQRIGAFDYVIINHDFHLDESVDSIRAIIDCGTSSCETAEGGTVNEYPRPSSEAQPFAPPPGPISLRLPSTPPRVTYAILGLTIFVYLLQTASNFLLGYDLPLMLGAKSGDLIRQGQIWRLITPVLLHGSLLHIGFNMYALFSFGTGLERRFGHLRFLVLYLLAGFSGNVLSFLFTSGISVGSSTSIFGLIVAEGIFSTRTVNCSARKRNRRWAT